MAAALLWVALVAAAQAAAAADPAAAATTSNIVAAAGAAPLWGGIGDISPSGPCASDVKSFCKDVGQGEGRVASCISKRLKATKAGNVAGRKVSDKCVEELIKFKMDRSDNINKDVPLARACKDDAAKLCKDASDVKSPGSIVQCLRLKRNKLGASCKTEVFRVQQEAATDFRLDYKLFQACKADVGNLCGDVEPGDGGVLECLDDKAIQVSWECKGQLQVFAQETGSDLRLSTKLFRACLPDYKRYCKDVEPGNMAAQECLEDHSDDNEFSAECKEELDKMIAKRVSDFKLDTALREACEADLQDTCSTTLQQMDDDDKVKRTALNCLQQYRDELKDDKCSQEVRRRMQRASRDIRFDETLAKECYDDRAKFCNDVQPGSARVIRCLQDNRKDLAQRCAAALFDHEVRMAEDIDFKFPMKKACAWEIANFCKDVPHGHARIIRCLEQNLDNSAMSQECKDETVKDMNRMATDYRLNWRLNHACEADINKLCRNMCSTQSGQACGGLVLQCLQDNQDNITSQACQDEVFYYQLMEVTDFRNDVILAEACRNDVETYCKDVEPGEGRVHQCLRFNRDKISDRCRNEEMKLQALEYRDIRLRPRLNKVCSEEKAVYCKDVKPGKARVIKCLMENMAQPNFGEDCKQELQEREHIMQTDYRYDVGVFTTCANDVETYCKEARSKLRGNATVLKCLVENFKTITVGCQTEMSRAVRLALWDYKPGAALTGVCDKDVEDQCPRGARSRSGAVFTIGVVGRCLSKSMIEGKRLNPKCRELVLAAAPKDARAYFETSESRNAVVQMVNQMQKAAGLDAVLVDPSAPNGSTVTVTGWVALACIISLIVVIVGGSVMLYRRFTGEDKPHTLHVKMGDA